MQKLVHSYLSKLAVVILKQYLLGIILSTVSQQLAITTSAGRAASVSNSCRTVSNRVDSIGVAIVCAFYTRLSLWLYSWETQAIPRCISVGSCVRAWHDAKLEPTVCDWCFDPQRLSQFCWFFLYSPTNFSFAINNALRVCDCRDPYRVESFEHIVQMFSLDFKSCSFF